MVTHLDAVAITVVLALVLMVSLTYVLFKECLHRAMQSQILLSPLYVTIHGKTKHIAHKVIFEFRPSLPTTTSELLLLQI